jgi:uncharacterized protein (DUF2141 family)
VTSLPALALAILAAGGAPVPESDARGTVVVSVEALRSRAGSVRVKLVASAEGFPGSDAHVVARRRLPVDGPAARVVFSDVPFGDYALVVLHDEDDDATLDRNVLGIPAEGLGFSSGARVRFGPPSFEDARFTLAEPELEIEIEVRY